MLLKDRFEKFFDKVNGCWEWKGALRGKGYGCFKVDGKNKIASRVSYELYKNSISPSKLVCHSCNNPKCVNPDHLYLGSYQDNTKQAVEQGRQFVAKGELNGSCKLTEAEILAIKSDTRSQRKIAKEYNCSQLHVSRIKRNLVWRYLNETV